MVVTAYEDFETGRHAKRTYDFLVGNLGDDWKFTNQMWKFNILENPGLREIAAKDAALADLIIVSSHGGGELPSHVKRWLEAWLALRGDALALVALFDCPRAEAQRTVAMRDYLADVARRARVEFFAQPDEWPGNKPATDFLLTQRTREVDARPLSTFSGVELRGMPLPRWGINE